MKAKINKLYNANIYVNGNSILGRAEEITLPQVKRKMLEHKALGMIGPSKFPAGIEAIENIKIKWASLYPDTLQEIADPSKPVKIQVRASLDEWEPAGRVKETEVVVYADGYFVNFPQIAFKQNENAELETEFAVNYYKLTVDKKVIEEVDLIANIWKSDKEDYLKNFKKNLGM